MTDLEQARAKARNNRRRRTQIKAMLTIITVLAAIVAAMPTMLLTAVGMVPTLTWFIVDMTPGRYACRCIAGFNVAGLSPYILKLWMGPNNMSAALAIVTDPFALFVFYGASALGFLLFTGLPGIVAVIKTLNAERQVRVLRQEQRDLIEEWGKSVAGSLGVPDPIDQDASAEPDAEAQQQV